MPCPRPTLPACAILVACLLSVGCARDSEAEAAEAARRAAADIETLPSPEAGVGSVTGMPKPGDPGARRPATAVAIDEYTAGVAEVETGSEARLVEADTDVEAAVGDASGADASAEVAADAGDLPLPPPAQPQAVVVPLERKQPLPPPPPANPPPPPTAAPLPAPPPEAGDEPAAQ